MVVQNPAVTINNIDKDLVKSDGFESISILVEGILYLKNLPNELERISRTVWNGTHDIRPVQGIKQHIYICRVDYFLNGNLILLVQIFTDRIRANHIV